MIVVAVLFNAIATAADNSDEFIRNGDFENATSSWSLLARNQGADAPGNNIVEINSDAQSPFTKGNQGLHIRVEEGSQIPPIVIQQLQVPVQASIRLQLSFRVNDSTTYSGGDGVLTVRLLAASGPQNDIVFRGNGFIQFSKQTVNMPSGRFDRGVWNSVSIDLPATESKEPAKITISSENGPPSTVEIPDWGHFEAGEQLEKIQIQTGYGARPITDIALDDIQISSR